MSQKSDFSFPGGLFSTPINKSIFQTSSASSQSGFLLKDSNNTTPSNQLNTNKKAKDSAKKRKLEESYEFREATKQLSLVTEQIHSKSTIIFFKFF